MRYEQITVEIQCNCYEIECNIFEFANCSLITVKVST